MLIVISKEQLAVILEEEIKCWESVSGGPNLNAFSFDPKTTDPQLLKQLGYYEDELAIPGRTWSVRLAVADCEVEKNGNMILLKDPSGLQFRLREQKFNFSLVF